MTLMRSATRCDEPFLSSLIVLDASMSGQKYRTIACNFCVHCHKASATLSSELQMQNAYSHTTTPDPFAINQHLIPSPSYQRNLMNPTAPDYTCPSQTGTAPVAASATLPRTTRSARACSVSSPASIRTPKDQFLVFSHTGTSFYAPLTAPCAHSPHPVLLARIPRTRVPSTPFPRDRTLLFSSLPSRRCRWLRRI